MPTLALTSARLGPAISTRDASGATVSIAPTRLYALLEVPGLLLPRDAIVDSGSPLTVFPEAIWSLCQPGRDFELLPFVGRPPQPARVLGWSFTFRIARFLRPLAFVDANLGTRVERPGAVVQFADGNPPIRPGARGLPPIIVGLWGGLLEGGRMGIERNPLAGGVRGEIAFP